MGHGSIRQNVQINMIERNRTLNVSGQDLTVCKLNPDSLLRNNFIFNVKMILCHVTRPHTIILTLKIKLLRSKLSGLSLHTVLEEVINNFKSEKFKTTVLFE